MSFIRRYEIHTLICRFEIYRIGGTWTKCEGPRKTLFPKGPLWENMGKHVPLVSLRKSGSSMAKRNYKVSVMEHINILSNALNFLLVFIYINRCFINSIWDMNLSMNPFLGALSGNLCQEPFPGTKPCTCSSNSFQEPSVTSYLFFNSRFK